MMPLVYGPTHQVRLRLPDNLLEPSPSRSVGALKKTGKRRRGVGRAFAPTAQTSFGDSRLGRRSACPAFSRESMSLPAWLQPDNTRLGARLSRVIAAAEVIPSRNLSSTFSLSQVCRGVLSRGLRC